MVAVLVTCAEFFVEVRHSLLFNCQVSNSFLAHLPGS